MKEETLLASEKSIDSLRENAERLARDPRLIQICHDSHRNRDLRAEALRGPMDLLRSRGINISPEFTIEFFEPPAEDLPVSDWIPFFLELTNCRTLWVRDCDDSSPPLCRLKRGNILPRIPGYSESRTRACRPIRRNQIWKSVSVVSNSRLQHLDIKRGPARPQRSPYCDHENKNISNRSVGNS